MAYLETAQKTRKVIDVSRRTTPILLAGFTMREHLHTAETDMAVRLIRAVYTEATSTHTGVAVRIGKIGHPDYFATFTSEISKSAGDVTEITMYDNRNILLQDETLTVDCDGLKAGTGIVIVQIELEGYR